MRKPPLPGRPSRDVRIVLRESREPKLPDSQNQGFCADPESGVIPIKTGKS